MQNLNVLGIQFDIVWKNKEENLAYLNREFEKLENNNLDLVVLPEMFQTGFCFDKILAENYHSSQTIIWLKNWALQLETTIMASLMVEENGMIFNRLVVVSKNDQIKHYDKRHLFSMSNEPQHFSAGNEKLIFEVNGWRICPMICYDFRFPVWVRNTEKYDVLVFVANWPQRRSMHWEKLLEARAIENQCYVVGINRIGDDGNGVYHDGRSAIINPLGEKIIQKINASGQLIAQLNKHDLEEIRLNMPFLNDGESFTILC